MTKLPIRPGVALCTFGIGVLAVTALRNFLAEDPSAIPAVTEDSRPLKREAVPGATFYSVNVCDLVKSGHRYDGKLVAMHAVYEQGKDTAALTDPNCEESWLRLECSASDESCEAIWRPLLDALRHGRSFRVGMDVVGRYSADIEDPNPLQGGSHVRMLEVVALKNAKPEKWRE